MEPLVLIVAIVLLGGVFVEIARIVSSILGANIRRHRWLRRASEGVEASGERRDSPPGSSLETNRWPAQDFTLTGTAVAAFGIAGVYTGYAIAYGPWAVSAYTAGLIAIVLGVGLAILGATLRILSRPLDDDTRDAS